MLKEKRGADSNPEDIKGQEVAPATLQRKAIREGDVLFALKMIMLTRSPKACKQ